MVQPMQGIKPIWIDGKFHGFSYSGSTPTTYKLLALALRGYLGEPVYVNQPQPKQRHTGFGTNE